MPVTIACTHCRKTYNVDAQTTGKKVRCKACGQVFVAAVAVANAPALQEVDIYSGLAAAASKERKSSPSAALDDSYDLAPRPTATATTGQCPHCHNSFPADHAVCMSCGYNRKTGQHISHAAPTPAAATASSTPRPVFSYSHDTGRDSRGIRTYVPHDNPGLAIIDNATPRIVLIVALVLLGFLAVYPIWEILNLPSTAGAPRPGFTPPEFPTGKFLFLAFDVIVAFAVAISIIAGASLGAIKLASMVMRHELPPDQRLARWFTVATSGWLVFLFYGMYRASTTLDGFGGLKGFLVALASTFLVWLTWIADFIALKIGFGSRGFGRPIMAHSMPGDEAFAFFGVVLLATLAMFGTYWFFFRSKLVESCVGFAFMAIGYVVGSGFAGIVLYCILWIGFRMAFGPERQGLNFGF